MSNPSPILSPGDRLKSKNGYSVVEINCRTSHGYYGTAYFKDSFCNIDSCSVTIGLFWEASYTQLPKMHGTRKIPIETQIPQRPTPDGKKEEGWFEAVKDLIDNGWTIREACKEWRVSANTYRERLTDERNKAMDKEFSK